MTNNDDFDQQDFEPTESLPPPKSGAAANLAEAWRSRPLFKLIVLMTAVGAIAAAGMSFFGGSSATKAPSRLVNPPALNASPGGPSSPYMQQQTDIANRDREAQALQSGGSALPTPIGQSTDISALSGTEPKKNDPLTELKAEIDHLRQDQQQTQKQQVQQQQVIQQHIAPRVQQAQQEQFDDTLATAMQREMSRLMTEEWKPEGVKEVTVLKEADPKAAASGQAGSLNAATGTASQAVASSGIPKTILPAGTVSYAQLLTEANSDVPGPIMAQIVSGPFSGARAIGSFQVANGYADYLVLQFNLVHFKGKDYPINAIALNPDTTLGGMATEVDQRYLIRVVLPAAAGFLQGFGQALGTGGSTTTTNGTSTIISQSREGYKQGIYNGLGAGAQTMSQFFQNQANLTKPLVRVAANTPMGLFFTSSVVDQTVQEVQQERRQEQLQNPYANGGYSGMLGNPYLNGNPYPGSTVTGYGAAAQTPQAPQTSSLPYPNYANPASTSTSPYSALPGQSTTVYTH